MCLAEISSTITNDACHPCLNPKTSKTPSSALASTNPFCGQCLDANQIPYPFVATRFDEKLLPFLNIQASIYPMDSFHLHSYEDSKQLST